MPTIGPGALEPPTDESHVYGTDKERTLFLPRVQTWREIAEECSDEGIGVSMFLGMSRPIDLGSIGTILSTICLLKLTWGRGQVLFLLLQAASYSSILGITLLATKSYSPLSSGGW